MFKWMSDAIGQLFSVLSSLRMGSAYSFFLHVSMEELQPPSELEELPEFMDAEACEYRFQIFAGPSLYSVDCDPVEVFFSKSGYDAIYIGDPHAWAIMYFIIEEESA